MFAVKIKLYWPSPPTHLFIYCPGLCAITAGFDHCNRDHVTPKMLLWRKGKTLKHLFFVEKSQLNPPQRYPDKIHLVPNCLSSITSSLPTLDSSYMQSPTTS